MSWKGHQDSRISKGSSTGWDTGKSSWNSPKGKGKGWQPCGKWSSKKGKFGSKGKGIMYSVGGITESDGWTQLDVANSEEDLHFCIMEHSQDVVMDDNQSCWRNGCSEAGRPARVEKWSLQDLTEEAETRSLYSSAQQLPHAWYIGT